MSIKTVQGPQPSQGWSRCTRKSGVLGQMHSEPSGPPLFLGKSLGTQLLTHWVSALVPPPRAMHPPQSGAGLGARETFTKHLQNGSTAEETWHLREGTLGRS